MTAPTLPREVFCFVEEVGDEQFPDTLVTVLTSERDLAAWREGVLRLKEAELSPIGRYVLADEERERLLNACVDALREIQMNMAGVASGLLPHFTREDLAGAAEHRAKAALDRLDAYEEHRKAER